jgi:hypothetical protein
MSSPAIHIGSKDISRKIKIPHIKGGASAEIYLIDVSPALEGWHRKGHHGPGQ